MLLFDVLFVSVAGEVKNIYFISVASGIHYNDWGLGIVFSPLFLVDAEGNQKVHLKYKCHTVKKLNMTRTLLTEKKEGEENVGECFCSYALMWTWVDYAWECQPLLSV